MRKITEMRAIYEWAMRCLCMIMFVAMAGHTRLSNVFLISYVTAMACIGMYSEIDFWSQTACVLDKWILGMKFLMFERQSVPLEYLLALVVLNVITPVHVMPCIYRPVVLITLAVAYRPCAKRYTPYVVLAALAGFASQFGPDDLRIGVLAFGMGAALFDRRTYSICTVPRDNSDVVLLMLSPTIVRALNVQQTPFHPFSYTEMISLLLIWAIHENFQRVVLWWQVLFDKGAVHGALSLVACIHLGISLFSVLLVINYLFLHKRLRGRSDRWFRLDWYRRYGVFALIVCSHTQASLETFVVWVTTIECVYQYAFALVNVLYLKDSLNEDLKHAWQSTTVSAVLFEVWIMLLFKYWNLGGMSLTDPFVLMLWVMRAFVIGLTIVIWTGDINVADEKLNIVFDVLSIGVAVYALGFGNAGYAYCVYMFDIAYDMRLWIPGLHNISNNIRSGVEKWSIANPNLVELHRYGRILFGDQ